MTRFIAPGSTLGVMGGGQLGRMFVHAAQRMGYLTAVLDPDPASPAGQVATYHIRADYLDEQGLAQLMQRCAAITTEFENVPAPALVTLGAHRIVAPGAAAVAVCQDRAAEKDLFRRCGVPCAPHAVVESAEGLATVEDDLLPAIVKTTRMGYDGKGQVRVRNRTELAAAWSSLGGVTCVVEKMLPIAAEVSVIMAREAGGSTVHFGLQLNLHRNGILAVTQRPALAPAVAHEDAAIAAARKLAEAMDYVGVLCVEFFVLEDGRLIANEMAPRPHNSGHATIDACDVSQFDLQVRVLTGAPLTTPREHSASAMLNLLGDLWFGADGTQHTPGWADVLALPGTHLHLYGKAVPRRGRKMGHLTTTAATPQQARTTALQAASLLGIEAF